MHLDEGPHPAPVLAGRGAHQRLLVQIGAGAERAVSLAGHDDHRHGVVPRRLLECVRHLLQGRQVERVQHLRPRDGDGGDAGIGVALVANALVGERRGIGRDRRARLSHRPRRER